MDVNRFDNFSRLLDRKGRGGYWIRRSSFKIVVSYLFVELDTNDFRVMGAVKKGVTTFGGIKSGINLKKDELVKILDILVLLLILDSFLIVQHNLFDYYF